MISIKHEKLEPRIKTFETLRLTEVGELIDGELKGENIIKLNDSFNDKNYIFFIGRFPPLVIYEPYEGYEKVKVKVISPDEKIIVEYFNERKR